MMSCVCRVWRVRLKWSTRENDVSKVTRRKTVKEYENGDGAQHREEWLLDRFANKVQQPREQTPRHEPSVNSSQTPGNYYAEGADCQQPLKDGYLTNLPTKVQKPQEQTPTYDPSVNSSQTPVTTMPKGQTASSPRRMVTWQVCRQTCRSRRSKHL
jgi:hypothetical protein